MFTGIIEHIGTVDSLKLPRRWRAIDDLRAYRYAAPGNCK